MARVVVKAVRGGCLAQPRRHSCVSIRNQRDAFDGVGGVLEVDPRAESFIPKRPRLPVKPLNYGAGKREEREEPMISAPANHIRVGARRWAGRARGRGGGKTAPVSRGQMQNARIGIYMVITYSRVWINPVRLPILLVAS